MPTTPGGSLRIGSNMWRVIAVIAGLAFLAALLLAIALQDEYWNEER